MILFGDSIEALLGEVRASSSEIHVWHLLRIKTED